MESRSNLKAMQDVMMNQEEDLLLPVPLKRANAEPKSDARVCVTCPTILPEDQEEFAVQCSDCFRDPNTRRACSMCNEKKIPINAPEWKRVCGTCYKNAGCRACFGCKEFKIKMTEPSWRTLCSECYKEKEKYLKMCTVCGKIPLKPGLPSYVTTCTKCYLKKKSETHEPCPSCPEQYRTHLRKRKFAPACRTCMTQQGLIQCAS